MSLRLVWRNTTHQKGRTALALAAISFAVVLLFMQLALYDSCIISARHLLDLLDADAVLLGADFSSMQHPGSLRRERLYQGLEVPGVQTVSPLYIRRLPWRNMEDGSRHPVLVLAVNPRDPVFLHAEVRDQLPRLHVTGQVLLDQQMLPYYGPAREGLVSEVGQYNVTVAGLFRNGAGFSAGGLLVTSDQTYQRLGFSLETPTLGLIKLRPGADPAATVAALQAKLPPDVKVLTRAELAAREIVYWTEIKPLGIIFSSGVFVGALVAAVILYQVLAADIARRLREFATMKAMGFSHGQINRMVLLQAAVLMLLCYGVGLACAQILYAVMTAGTGFPFALTLRRAALVFGLTLLIALVSGVLALRKLRAADPADLF